MKASLILPTLSVLALAGSANALTPAQEKAELERIGRERDQVQARYAERERQCKERFVVTPCIEEARRERRASLERLRAQEEVVNEAQRKQRAAQRIDEIRAKVSGDEARRREMTARDRRMERQTRQAAEPPAQAPSEPAAAAPTSRSASAADSEASRKRAEYERRQQEARAHREDVERRLAQKKASGKKPAASLPLPEPASRPASSR